MRRVRRRLRWARAVRWLAWGGSIAGALWCLVVIVWLVAPIPRGAVVVAGCAFAAALAVGAIAGALWPTERGLAARVTDRRLALAERVSSAVAFLERAGGTALDPFEALVVEDAAAKLGGVSVAHVVPMRLPRVWRYGVVLSAVAVGLAFLPPYRSKAHREAAADRQAIIAEGERLETLAREEEVAATNAELAETRDAAQRVAELGKVFRGGQVDRREALRDLTRAADELRERQERMLGQPPVRSLAERALGSGATRPAMSRELLQRQLQRLQQQMGTQRLPAMQELDRLRNQLGEAMESLHQAQMDGGKLDSAQQQRLADMLTAMQRGAEGLGALEQDLAAALKALQQMDVGVLTQRLDDAVIDLEELAERLEEVQRLQEQMAELGKDLPEMLERGQAGPASERLREMAEKLAAGQKPTADELQALAEEVRRGLAAAKPYGELGEHLQKALAKLDAEQLAEAAESLQDAAAALEKLQQQLADLQATGKLMQQLRDAQMRIANRGQAGACKACGGKGCSQCQGSGLQLGPGGRPGPGGQRPREGIFPMDADLWKVPEWTVPRVDGVPAGEDAGDPQPPELAEPGRVPGQLSPGGPMPGMSLRGLSIEGASQLEYERAVEAARGAAEEALSKEQIPRSYQDVIRRYFDEIPAEVP